MVETTQKKIENKLIKQHSEETNKIGSARSCIERKKKNFRDIVIEENTTYVNQEEKYK